MAGRTPKGRTRTSWPARLPLTHLAWSARFRETNTRLVAAPTTTTCPNLPSRGYEWRVTRTYVVHGATRRKDSRTWPSGRNTRPSAARSDERFSQFLTNENRHEASSNLLRLFLQYNLKRRLRCAPRAPGFFRRAFPSFRNRGQCSAFRGGWQLTELSALVIHRVFERLFLV